MSTQLVLNLADSNTTLVKVKCNGRDNEGLLYKHSNTTLVKVKCNVQGVRHRCSSIQIQLLLKLNN